MGSGFRLTANLATAKKQVDFFRSWKGRLKKIEANIGWLAANHIKTHVESRLPKNGSTETYRKSLEVARIRGTSPGSYGYVVQIDERDPDVREVQPNKQLIYVAPARKTSRPAPEILILQKYSPWTLDTIPFKPDSKVATVTTRTVRALEVLRVTQQRTRQRSQWAHEFKKAGVRLPARSQGFTFPKSMVSLPNVALDALRLEFGLGKQKANPAWRLAFRGLIKQGFASFVKDRKNFVFPLTKPSFSVWKKWPPRTKHTASIAQAKKYKGFQKKISPNSG